jgi:hypothetical protein
MSSKMTKRRRDAIDRFWAAVTPSMAGMTDVQRVQFQRSCDQILQDDRVTTNTIIIFTQIIFMLV